MILTLLGASAEDVQADYVLSQQAAGLLAAQMTFDQFHPNFEADARQQRIANWTPEKAVAGSLRHLEDEFGGVAGFLAHIGVTTEQLDALRRVLVEPPAAAAARL